MFIKKEKVRLAGIDTAEIFRPSCDAEKAHGFEAKKFVVETLTLDWKGTMVLRTEKRKR